MELTGDGIFSDAYNWVADGVKKLRKSKIISKVGNEVGSWGIPYVSDVAGRVGKFAGQYGFGKKAGKIAGYGPADNIPT